MSYNEQVEEFVKGDLVYFTGYQVERSPLAHKLGIVMKNGMGSKPYTMYEVMWLHTGNIITVAAKHLTLAYTR
tara:strand:- start:682 stop:900 length:219 start_codon:yes stop_codon:yes gene_type:complete